MTSFHSCHLAPSQIHPHNMWLHLTPFQIHPHNSWHHVTPCHLTPFQIHPHYPNPPSSSTYLLFAYVLSYLYVRIYVWLRLYNRDSLRALAMTACDLAANTKPWQVTQQTVKVIFDEFYEQVKHWVVGSNARGLKNIIIAYHYLLLPWFGTTLCLPLEFKWT